MYANATQDPAALPSLSKFTAREEAGGDESHSTTSVHFQAKTRAQPDGVKTRTRIRSWCLGLDAAPAHGANPPLRKRRQPLLFHGGFPVRVSLHNYLQSLCSEETNKLERVEVLSVECDYHTNGEHSPSIVDSGTLLSAHSARHGDHIYLVLVVSLSSTWEQVQQGKGKGERNKLRGVWGAPSGVNPVGS